MTIPHGGAVLLTEACPHLVVRAVTKELWPSDSFGLRLTFANAGTVELQVPVGTPDSPLPRQAVPGFDTHGGGHEATSGGEHGSSPSTSAGSDHGNDHGNDHG
jgi:copper(I)-binding protein